MGAGEHASLGRMARESPLGARSEGCEGTVHSKSCGKSVPEGQGLGRETDVLEAQMFGCGNSKPGQGWSEGSEVGSGRGAKAHWDLEEISVRTPGFL